MQMTDKQIAAVRRAISATISQHVPSWRYGRERTGAMTIIMEVLRATGCFDHAPSDPVLPEHWEEDSRIMRFEHSSSSYAIGSGPKTLIAFLPDKEEWEGVFQEWCAQSRRWRNYDLDQDQVRVCLYRCIKGQAPRSMDEIAGWVEQRAE